MTKNLDTLDIAREVLCNVAQLIAGWKVTTPPAEWSEWDEQTLQSLLDLQRRIEQDNQHE